MKQFWMLVGSFVAIGVGVAQTPVDSQQQSTPPQGQVLFQSHGAPPETVPEPQQYPSDAAKATGPELTDAERSAIFFTAYDLDARITPATSTLVMRARVTLRNDSPNPLFRIALQVSSTLHWESATLLSSGSPVKLELTQHLLDTDADHTGKASEAVITLPQALAPGDSLQLDAFYSGTVLPSAERLVRIGASATQGLETDWDAITPDMVALRGFGNVLWYPVASPQLFLGEGAQLFDAVGLARLHEQAASIRLRLSIEYKGDPPAAAYFCGRRKAFTALPDDGDASISTGTGIATAEFAAEPLGFRTPSLFVVNLNEHLLAPLSAENTSATDAAAPTTAQPAFGISSSSSVPAPAVIPGSSLLAMESDDDGAMNALSASAEKLAPILQDWLGVEPLSALTVIDHHGQPFEDGPLLIAPASSLAASDASSALIHSLTHAWVQTGRPWMDEGLAQFFSLLWVEHESGREAFLAQLNDLLQPLPALEPDITPASAKEPGATHELVGQVVGQPLIAASSEVFYRRKAAAVWMMLRNIVGDDALSDALHTWRLRTPGKTSSEEDALAFEKLIERSGKDNAKNPINLHWFFNDWVLHDRGLPDLSISNVTPRALPPTQGHSGGFFVSVAVKNDGAAEVQVPVTIRSASFSTTSQLRVPGFATAAARVVVESAPTEVLVNDGTIPEVRTSFHRVVISDAKPE